MAEILVWSKAGCTKPLGFKRIARVWSPPRQYKFYVEAWASFSKSARNVDWRVVVDGEVASPRRSGAVLDHLADLLHELAGYVRFLGLVESNGIKAVVSELEQFEDFSAETGIVFVAID